MRQHSCAFTPYIDLTRKGSSRDVLKETAIRPMPRVCMLAMRWTERARDSTIPDRVVTARTSRANEVESMQRSVENGQGSCAPARSTKSSLSLNMQLLISRKRFAYSLLGAALTCAFKPKAAHAMTMRTLKRALVNIVRVREGSILLSTRLEDNLLDGFQDSVKLLVADTQLKENVNLACQGLSELQIDTSLRLAEEKGDRIVQVCMRYIARGHVMTYHAPHVSCQSLLLMRNVSTIFGHMHRGLLSKDECADCR